jgi:FkbM family methyltransferase
VECDLIYDVGIHDGNDTAYYLAEGYRVLAIDANPAHIERATKRFEHELNDERLTLLSVAIGPEEGATTFWICDAVSEWSSLDEQIAARLGLPYHAVTVECRKFSNIVREHGVPLYLKVDIETADRHCLAGLDPDASPRYVSVEFSDLDDLIALRRLGYDAFKVIHQAQRFGHAQFRAGREAPSSRSRPATGVPPGPSGPFGEAAEGDWVGFEETAYDLLSFVLGHSEFGDPPDWFIWFDIHATRLEWITRGTTSASAQLARET